MSEQPVGLDRLFNNSIFRIPDYQRGYSWGDSQLMDFWDDLVNLQNGHYHYTGMLSLKELPKKEWESWIDDKWIIEKKGFTPYHVIDGQQRITTCVILMNEIICLAEKNNIEEINLSETSEIKKQFLSETAGKTSIQRCYKFGYEKDNPSFDYFRYSILGAEGAPELEETFYTRNLARAKEFFVEKLQHELKENGFAAIEDLFRKLTVDFRFSIHLIDNEIDVFVAFETMNNRGKKLSNLELLKNRLIYLSTLFIDREVDDDEKQALRRDINDAWKEVYGQLGRKKNHSLNDDEYLSAHWILFFGYSRATENAYVNFLLKQKFIQKNIYSAPSATELIPEEDDDAEDNDSEIVKTTTKTKTQKLTAKEIAKYVTSLKELAKFWYYSYHPNDCELLSKDEKIWIDKLNRVGMSYFRPLVTVALSKGIVAEKRVKLFKAIERFIFVCFRLGMFQSSYQNHIYYNKASELFETANETMVDEVTNSLNKTTDEAMQEALDKFKARMIRSYKEKDGFYDWKNLRYFLYEAEFDKYVKSGIERLFAEDYFLKSEKDKFSIEHIYPQTPSEWYWQNTYRNFTDEEKRSLTNSLGNLLPLSRSVNSSLQNHIFDKKKERYSRGSHSEAEVGRNKDWTAKEIYERGMRLLEFMNDRWALGLSRSFLAETLNIEFVNDGRDEKPEIPYFDKIEKKPRTEEDKYKKSDPITVEQYLQDKKENMVSLFGLLKAEILKTYPDAEEHVIPRYVAYSKKGTYFVEVQIQRSNIMLLTLTPDISEDLVGKKISDGYDWTLNYRCYMKTEEDISDVMKVIKLSYEKR